MAEIDTDNLKELFEKASQIASVVPENMQPEAFNRALEALQAGFKQKSNSEKTIAKKIVSDTDPISDDQWWQSIDSSRYPDIFTAPNGTHRALRILQIARDDFNTDYVTANTISTLLLKKFKIDMATKTVSARLGDVLKYVNRQSEGNGYKYSLMHPGDEYLAGNASKAPSPSTKPKRTAPKKKEEDQKEQPDSSTNKPKKNGSRPGPKGMLENLIKAGFFSQPKTIPDILKHVTKNFGYTYKNTDLSPALVRLVRAQKLGRDENSSGQYEYTAK